MENLFNVNQVAFILKVHPLTIRRYIREGRLKAVKVGGNIRIKESELQNFHKDHNPRFFRHFTSRKIQDVAKIFSQDDPILKLQGRGASLNASS